MKYKNILLLTTILLTQPVLAWAMWNGDDEAAMERAGNGQQRLTAQRIGFVPLFPPEINDLRPSPDPVNLGMAKQKMSCTFTNIDDPVEVTLPTLHPLRGEWVYIEDRDNHQDIATLKFHTLLNNQREDVCQRTPIPVPHILINEGEEVLDVTCHFDGRKVFRKRTKLQYWQSPGTGEQYDGILTLQDAAIIKHQGYTIGYVEPFVVRGEPIRPRIDYEGEYSFRHELAGHERLQGIKVWNLLLCDGEECYLPHVTQELWTKPGVQAGFFIASYKKDKPVHFPGHVLFPMDGLSKGLYHLEAFQDR